MGVKVSVFIKEMKHGVIFRVAFNGKFVTFVRLNNERT